ncbi:MAG TPA: HDOD domain-containing protein [Dissulfurispiraceae bacterium]|nr:HDOD domain-containing protein [Dissulfurispiraceae bacterium]
MKEEILEKIILETVDIPSLPPIAMKVLQLINDDYSSIKELEKIIGRDQAFSARLLRIANSPYYGRDRSINTISTGILIIGFNTMKSLVVAASLKDLHRKFGLFEQRLWEHSLGVSIAASILANETQMLSAEEAMVGGLIHDVGKTILNNSMPESYAVIVERVYESGAQFHEVELEMLGFTHCNVGGLIARKWKLPEALEAAAEMHHTTDFSGVSDKGLEKLCKVITVADAMAVKLGIGLRRPMAERAVPFELLGMSAGKYVAIEELFKKTFAEQKAQLLD